MLSRTRTTPVLLTAAALAVGGTAVATGADAAGKSGPSPQITNTSWNLHYTASATTSVKKMNQTTSTTGTADAVYTFGSGSLTTDLKLNDFKTPVKLGGLQIGYATIATENVGKATGSIDPTTHRVTQTQKAYLHIKDISPAGHGIINLVGKQCRTASPVTMKVSGQMKGGFDPVTLSGTYDIGQFQNCGLSTNLVNKQVPGSGNTISLTLTP